LEISFLILILFYFSKIIFHPIINSIQFYLFIIIIIIFNYFNVSKGFFLFFEKLNEFFFSCFFLVKNFFQPLLNVFFILFFFSFYFKSYFLQFQFVWISKKLFFHHISLIFYIFSNFFSFFQNFQNVFFIIINYFFCFNSFLKIIVFYLFSNSIYFQFKISILICLFLIFFEFFLLSTTKKKTKIFPFSQN